MNTAWTRADNDGMNCLFCLTTREQLLLFFIVSHRYRTCSVELFVLVGIFAGVTSHLFFDTKKHPIRTSYHPTLLYLVQLEKNVDRCRIKQDGRWRRDDFFRSI